MGAAGGLDTPAGHDLVGTASSRERFCAASRHRTTTRMRRQSQVVMAQSSAPAGSISAHATHPPGRNVLTEVTCEVRHGRRLWRREGFSREAKRGPLTVAGVATAFVRLERDLDGGDRGGDDDDDRGGDRRAMTTSVGA